MPITGNEMIDIWITAIWIIGITNAVNLLDNMDGLAAGIAAIGGIGLAANFFGAAQGNEFLFASVLIGGLVGFLFFNFNPASIFMGDCGSMFVGFVLSGAVLINQAGGGGRSRGILPILAVPALILIVPIFDTTLVTLVRKVWGRKVSQGGRDHTSHRLVALGLSERSAVLMLYAFAAIAGGLSIAITHLAASESLALIAFVTIVLVIVGVFLSDVKVYESSGDAASASEKAVFSFIINFSHKRRIFEILLDSIIITLSLYAAFILVIGSFDDAETWDLFVKCLPFVIPIKLAAFLVTGVYRGVWRYTSIRDFITYAKGVALGSAVSVLAILLLYRFQFYSRTVFVVDALLLLFGVIGSRMMFRLIRSALPIPAAVGSRRVLIYGAGDGGEMVLRELRNNPEWNLTPIGFVDDDPLKKGRVIHGLTVFDGNGSLGAVCREKDVQEIVISIRHFDSERLRTVREACIENNVAIRRALLKIETLE
ncbi:MAG: UDP-N-acetylmuramyl pentapeptide phosphotransferase/UDP-N-acetylglucosamine-1-phosphate transferase [Acidobacteria bacterium OLB17]|nr:MAG: UDP-N-acetylmuramyl pentapeptide phosphotransferase/UDP-N-acetylglucosamine-1-phosphate transferase [Acidobacteria bacterium OLB17]